MFALVMFAENVVGDGGELRIERVAVECHAAAHLEGD